MSLKPFLLATLAYVVVSFALGFTWHMVFFREAYANFAAYTREPPIIAFGFASMVIQGGILAMLFPRFLRTGTPFASALQFALLTGLFLWSVAVLAFAAKSNVNDMGGFFLLSSLFHVVQFGLYGALLGLIHAKGAATR